MIAPSLPPTLTQNPTQHTRLCMKSGRLSWQRKGALLQSCVLYFKKRCSQGSSPVGGTNARVRQVKKKKAFLFATAVSRYEVDAAKVQEHDHASLKFITCIYVDMNVKVLSKNHTWNMIRSGIRLKNRY